AKRRPVKRGEDYSAVCAYFGERGPYNNPPDVPALNMRWLVTCAISYARSVAELAICVIAAVISIPSRPPPLLFCPSLDDAVAPPVHNSLPERRSTNRAVAVTRVTLSMTL